MLSSKNESMKPLLESVNGIHFTAYIKNRGDLSDLRKQLRDTLQKSTESLAESMSVSEIESFLAPIHALAADGKRLKSFNANIGIFRTPTSFRVLSIPVEVENSSTISDTFHVKPLLKWMQFDREFLLLGIDSGTATLYQGSLHTFKQVDSVIFPRHLGDPIDDSYRMPSSKQKRLEESMAWLNGWIMNLTADIRPRLFIAGNRDVTRSLRRVLQYENLATHGTWPSFNPKLEQNICSEIRSILKNEAKKNLVSALVEFHYASEVNLAKRNLFSIARAAVQGRIRKLLISDGIKIFGKLDRKSGELAIHRREEEHNYDDILDDLAQTVLANGGEVVVASKYEIPKGGPILAITDEPSQLEMTQAIAAERKFDIERVRSAV